ncbi:hypothetical protein B0H13DRAFT_1925543 [Mycena leptocephala]|nr:hypothetical protein B0H13DRAFT_1925543 [Mycena leptocephala]
MSAFSSPQAGSRTTSSWSRSSSSRPAFHRAHSGSNLRARVHTSRLTRTPALPPPPMRIVSICRLTTVPRNASAEPPSYPPASSTEVDIKQHAHARITTCAPHARTTAQAPRPAHEPSPADERAHIRPCRSDLESGCKEERLPSVKGPRAKKETRKEKMERKGTMRMHPAPSLLFLPHRRAACTRASHPPRAADLGVSFGQSVSEGRPRGGGIDSGRAERDIDGTPTPALRTEAKNAGTSKSAHMYSRASTISMHHMDHGYRRSRGSRSVDGPGMQ